MAALLSHFSLLRPVFARLLLPRRAPSYLNLHGNLLDAVPPPIVWADMKKLKTLYIGGNNLPLPDHTNIHTAPQAF